MDRKMEVPQGQKAVTQSLQKAEATMLRRVFLQALPRVAVPQRLVRVTPPRREFQIQPETKAASQRRPTAVLVLRMVHSQVMQLQMVVTSSAPGTMIDPAILETIEPIREPGIPKEDCKTLEVGRRRAPQSLQKPEASLAMLRHLFLQALRRVAVLRRLV
jgi:hypothetical protein